MAHLIAMPCSISLSCIESFDKYNISNSNAIQGSHAGLRGTFWAIFTLNLGQRFIVLFKQRLTARETYRRCSLNCTRGQNIITFLWETADVCLMKDANACTVESFYKCFLIGIFLLSSPNRCQHINEVSWCSTNCLMQCHLESTVSGFAPAHLPVFLNPSWASLLAGSDVFDSRYSSSPQDGGPPAGSIRHPCLKHDSLLFRPANSSVVRLASVNSVWVEYSHAALRDVKSVVIRSGPLR